MALDLLKGAAQGVVGRGLRKVAGNLPGLLGLNKGRGETVLILHHLKAQSTRLRHILFLAMLQLSQAQVIKDIILCSSSINNKMQS